MGASDLVLAIAALFIPPFAVVVKRGCSFDVIINILLCCLGWIPGVLHAWYIIFKYSRGRRGRAADAYHRGGGGGRPMSSRSSTRSHRSREKYFNAPLPEEPAPAVYQDMHYPNHHGAPPPGRYY